jgi:hypothetical protein
LPEIIHARGLGADVLSDGSQIYGLSEPPEDGVIQFVPGQGSPPHHVAKLVDPIDPGIVSAVFLGRPQVPKYSTVPKESMRIYVASQVGIAYHLSPIIEPN